MNESTTSYIQLEYSRDGKVVVTDDVQDRFLISVQEAVIACKDMAQSILYRRQFGMLVVKLGAWLQRHRQKVRKAFLTAREGTLLFLVVRSTAQFDASVTDALTDLAIDVSNDDGFSLMRLDVLALPDASDEAVKSFLMPDRHKEVANAD